MSRLTVPSMNSPPSIGITAGADQAALIQQFEGEYKTVLRELADKDRIIDELRAQMKMHAGAGGARGVHAQADVRAVLLDETKKALTAKDAEIARLRTQVCIFVCPCL
jgi:hypothetical protein